MSLSFDILLRDRFSNTFNRMSDNADQRSQRLKASLNEITVSAERAGEEISNVDTGFESLGKRKMPTGLVTGIVAGLAGVTMAAKAIGDIAIDTEAKYSRFQAVLNNTLGSRSEARAAMGQLTRFASATPFQVDELTESFVKLANQGFKPTSDEMTNLGDLAASKAKSFDQLTEALIDAEVGEFERLKEFGIRASKEGDKVTFTFKGQQTVVANNEKAIRQYILGLGKMNGVAGSMASISKTTGGRISNLKDTVDQLYLAIGERLQPATHAGLGLMSKWVAKATEWTKVPVSDTLERERTQVNLLVAELLSAETPLERRNEIYNTLKEIAPEVVEGINAENIAVEELRKNLEAYNVAAIRRIDIEKNREKYEKMLGKAEETRINAVEAASYIRTDLEKKINRFQKTGMLTEAGILSDILYGDPNESTGSKAERAAAYLESHPQYEKASYRYGPGGQNEKNQDSRWDTENLRNRALSFSGALKRSEVLLKEANDERERSEKFFGASLYGSGAASQGSLGASENNGGKTLNSGIDSIRGDVAASRNITINLESLIKEVKNEFNNGNFDPADIEDRLKSALMAVLNDTNNI